MFHLIKSKGCQRCGGDLFREQDQYGVYISCIQCGAITTESSEQDIKSAKSKQLVEAGDRKENYKTGG